MLTLSDGRNELWQWDTGRKMSVDAECSQVHFSNKIFGRSIDVDVISGVATIPDILLQTDKDLNVWAFVGTAEDGYTKISKVFKVNRRNKPADYVFTPPEQTSLEEIKEKIEHLESIQDPDAIKNAVEDYLEQNPVDAPVQSVNGKTGKVFLTATDVGAISQDDLQEATNKALKQAKESGEFDGPAGDDYVLTNADKVEIAEMAAGLVEVPDSGGNVDQVSVEPAKMDRPKIFFGSPLQQTKDEIVTTFSYRSETLSFDCYAEIKAQGNSTLNWPKKNQTVKLYKDAACTEKFKVDFKGWGKQNKFVIKANWRDLTHVRDIVSVRLEGDCMRSNPDYEELPELLKTSPNLGGIDGFPVVVYAAGVYQGRYMWNIPKDKWMTNMDDELDEHCIICSEDYNSSCFRAAANINGNDWTDEIHDTVPASIKTRWNEVISFVMNSTDEEFVANLDSYIKVSTLIDRHIMGLYSCDYDGYGKNQLYITYDGQQWYADRYDKDGTWGNYWTGNSMLPSDYGRDQYEDMISGRPGNLLFIRLEQLFYQNLQERWDYLKVNELSIPNTIHRFRELYDITPPYVIEEDYASTTANGAFTEIPNKTTCTIQQIEKFVVERHAWMDAYVSALTGGESEPDAPEKTLISISATYTGGNVAVGTAVSALTGIVVTATYSDGSTATVAGYTLSGEISEGENTITVSYGGMTTTFTVTGYMEEEADPLYMLENVTNFEVRDRYQNEISIAYVNITDGNHVSIEAENGSTNWYMNVNLSSLTTHGQDATAITDVWFTIPANSNYEWKFSNISVEGNVGDTSFGLLDTSGEWLATTRVDNLADGVTEHTVTGTTTTELAFTCIESWMTLHENSAVSFDIKFYVNGVRYI